MLNIVLFSERLGELMFDNKLNATQLAAKINTSKANISRYLHKNCIPSVDMLITLADCFEVSMDFLLGLEEYNSLSSFKRCPSFSERFAFLLEKFPVTKYRLEKDTHIDDETIYAWLKGKNKPSIENIIKLAEYFKCTVDFILGRE